MSGVFIELQASFIGVPGVVENSKVPVLEFVSEAAVCQALDPTHDATQIVRQITLKRSRNLTVFAKL